MSVELGKVYITNDKPYKIGKNGMRCAYLYFPASSFIGGNEINELNVLYTENELYATIGSPYSYKVYTDEPINGCSTDNLVSPVVTNSFELNSDGGGAIIISKKPQFLSKNTFIKDALVIPGQSGDTDNVAFNDYVYGTQGFLTGYPDFIPFVAYKKNNVINYITDGLEVPFKNSFNVKDVLTTYCSDIGLDVNNIMWNNMGGAWDCKYLQPQNPAILQEADWVYFGVCYMPSENTECAQLAELELDIDEEFYVNLMQILAEAGVNDMFNSCFIIEIPEYTTPIAEERNVVQVYGTVL